MKKKICFALGGLLLLIQGLRAQELTENPAFPVDTSTVTITVDCTKGNQGLLNYGNTSDVYVHIGVITSASTGPADWRYSPFTWGTTNPLAKATSLGSNKYSYTINHIRSFFGVPPGETITRIAILFRNGSGSLAQRNSDGGDMYVQVYTLSLADQFALPPSQPKYNPVPEPINKKVGDSIDAKFLSNQFASLSIYLNGALAAHAASADSVERVIPIAAAGNQQLVGIADNGSGTLVSDTLNFFVSGAVNIAPIPSGAHEGINYPAGDTSATLVLFAPHKHKVVVIGDFTNWLQQTNYQMNETPDSNYFWLTIGGLTAGTEYAYQYVIDDSLVLADYNTEKVLDKNVDPGIPSSTYPGLKAFPSGASGTLASVLQTHQTPYNWQVSNFQRPDKKNLLIYELWLSDLTSAGNWQSLIDTLAYFKHLGVNAIEVEPFTNFEGANSWGYNPNFYFAPDKVYGTATALKQFVDACHQQGMAVIMDLVMNHSFGSSPMVQMYWNGALGVPAANNPWFNQYPTHAFNVGYQFNHESGATRTFTQRVIDYWLTNFHVDGYRWDLAKGFTQTKTCDATGNNCNVGVWGNYDASRVAIWDTIYNRMQAASPNSYCILEMFADQSEQKVEAATGMLLWGADLNTSWNQATLGYSTVAPGGATWDLSPIIYSVLGWAVPNNVVYQESHDDERMMYNNEHYGNSNGSGYSIKDTATALKRNGMATAFWAMAPGPKMLTEFGELGFDYSINWCTNGTVDASGSCRLTPKPIRWDYLKNPARLALHDVYASMLRLRNLYPALANPPLPGLVYSLTGAVKSLQVTTDSLSVVVIGNFDVAPNTGSVTFSSAGTWYDYLSGEPFTATGGSQSFNLAAGEYHVYVNKNLTNTVTTPVWNVNNDPNALQVSVFPNPTTGGNSTIRYTLPGYGKASLVVLNFQGQILATADLGDQAIGQHTVPLSQLNLRTSALATGYYVLKLVFRQESAQTGFLVGRP